MKNKTLAEGGFAYKMLHHHSDRLLTSFGLTLIMLIVATAASFFIPAAFYLPILFGPGAALYLFGGKLTRKHSYYGLSTNQRLAIERYESADEETQKMFPQGFVETVRNAKTLGPNTDGRGSDAYRLSVMAQKIIDAQAKRREASGMAVDDDVEVALQFMQQNIEAVESDTKLIKEVYGPPTIKKMVGRKVVEMPNPLYGRVQDK